MSITPFLQSIRSSAEGFFASIDFSQHPFYLLDILIIAVGFYYLYVLLRNTRAVPILTGLIIIVIVSLISQRLKLSGLNWLLGHSVTLLVIAIPVVFRDELRRGLETIGQTRFFRHRGETRGARKTIRDISKAARYFAENKIGALIVIRRSTNLSEVVETGIKLYADLSTELLQTIFHPGSALHDGAVIIEENQIMAASCVLPLSFKSTEIKFGTRHKAALGISEHTDAIAIVVSEERGHIALAVDGELMNHISPDALEKNLMNLLEVERPTRKKVSWPTFKRSKAKE